MRLISSILSSVKFKDILKSVKDAKWAGDEVKNMASSAFGLSENVSPNDLLTDYLGLDGAIRYLRAFRFEVSEGAASLLNESVKIDEMLMWIEKQRACFDLEELKKAADDELKREAEHEH